MSNPQIVSIEARIAKLQTQLADLKAKAAAGVTVEKLIPDETEVIFKSGKDGEAAQGTVIGVAVPEGKGPTVVKVFVKAGVNSRVASPFLSQIVKIVGQDTPEVETEGEVG